jgi:hypothetical protein
MSEPRRLPDIGPAPARAPAARLCAARATDEITERPPRARAGRATAQTAGPP